MPTISLFLESNNLLQCGNQLQYVVQNMDRIGCAMYSAKLQKSRYYNFSIFLGYTLRFVVVQDIGNNKNEGTPILKLAMVKIAMQGLDTALSKASRPAQGVKYFYYCRIFQNSGFLRDTNHHEPGQVLNNSGTGLLYFLLCLLGKNFRKDEFPQ